MTHDDPYVSPRAPVADLAGPEHPIRWRRVVGWGALVFAVSAAIYMVSGFLDSRHTIYGIKADDILASAASFFLYFVFLRLSFSRHLLQLTAVFLSAFLLDLMFGLATNLALHFWVNEPFDNPVSFSELLRKLIICLLAYVAWGLTARKGKVVA